MKTCSICFDEIEIEFPLECNHVFHEKCIVEYFINSEGINKCPQCRCEHTKHVEMINTNVYSIVDKFITLKKCTFNTCRYKRYPFNGFFCLRHRKSKFINKEYILMTRVLLYYGTKLKGFKRKLLHDIIPKLMVKFRFKTVQEFEILENIDEMSETDSDQFHQQYDIVSSWAKLLNED